MHVLTAAVCFGLTGLSLACVCVFIRNHDVQMSNKRGVIIENKRVITEEENYSKSTDLLFTRLLNAISSFSSLFSYSISEEKISEQTLSSKLLNSAANKGPEKSLKQLVNVLTGKKFLEAIQNLKEEVSGALDESLNTRNTRKRAHGNP